MATNENNPTRTDMWRQMARGVGGVALVFSLVVGVLLTTDWMCAGQDKTLYSSALNQVLTQARQMPDRGVVWQAREMDCVARHAYFSSVAFRNTGVWLLVAGLAVTVGCLHLTARLGRTIEDPRRYPAVDQARANRAAQLTLLLTSVGGLLWLVVWALARVPATADAAPHAMALAGTSNPVSAVLSGRVSAVTAPNGADARMQLWSCFRGPRCGVAEGTNAPTVWDGKTGVGVLWHVPLAKPGPSSPVVRGGKVFLTVADAQIREVVAYDAANGRELWRQTVADGGKGEAVPKPQEEAARMWAGLGVPTAACDDAGVYAVFGTGDLVAYSQEGKLRWQVYLHRPVNEYGHASSLVAAGGKVFVQYDQKETGRVLAIDAQNGQTIWEQKRMPGESWSSPVVVSDADGKSMLLVNGAGVLSAYDLSFGRALWSVEGVTGDVSPSPAYWNGRFLVANAYARMVCYEGAEKPVKVWEYSKVLPDVASPVAADGLVYLGTSEGQIACVDARDGTELWKHDYPAGFYASPVVCGGRVYALDREGVMRIFAAERSFRELAACPLGESADATPAFADKRIFIRTTGTLWCVGAK